MPEKNPISHNISLIARLGERTLTSAMEIAHLGCWEWNIQDGSEIWSDEQFRIFGYEPGEIEPSHDLFVESVHPDDRDRVLKAVENVLAGFEPNRIEFRILRPDKTERIVISQGKVFRDDAGNPLKMIGTVFDITSQKRIQQAEKKYEDFVLNSVEAVWAYDLEPPLPMDLTAEEQLNLLYERAYISEANNALARMLGYEKGEELLGMRLNDFQPRTNPENVAYVKNVVREKFNVTDFETTTFGSAGEKRILISNILGIKKNGKLLRIWGTSRDVTKQKRMEEELLRNEKDLQKLAGQLITHQENECSRIARELHDDLTQQLAVIAIEAGNMERQFKNLPEIVRQKVSNIKDQLIKVSKEVHNLSRGLHPSILYDLGLERAVRSECRNFLSRTGITVVFDPKNVPDNIPIDISLSVYRIIQECLQNISNHAKTKKAYVHLEGNSEKITLVMRDSGVGFDQEKVREKTGLGLASMRERMRLVNGELSITSKPGKGTHVEVTIPFPKEK
jgi:PAS domain S-box-containing protein